MDESLKQNTYLGMVASLWNFDFVLSCFRLANFRGKATTERKYDI